MDQLKQKYSTQILWIKEVHKKYEQFLPALFFSTGFIFDVMTLGDIDDTSNIIMLSFYMFCCAFLLALEFIDWKPSQNSKSYLHIFSTYQEDIFHFLLGALLSAFTLFYFKSSSLASSFIFLSLMVILLLLNELEAFKKKGLIIKSSLFKLCLISYFFYIIPLLLGTSGQFIFYVCIILASLITLAAFWLIYKKGYQRQQGIKEILLPQMCMALIFIFLHACKIIPPIPLSLKYIGIFHQVEKTDNGGYVTSQLTPSWKFWTHGDQDFKARQDDSVYVFTNIFAPGGYEGTVYIRWIQLLSNKDVTSDRIPLTITGGRANGFRGFAFKQNYQPGQWQIRVETENGLEIGRINFEITKDKSTAKRTFHREERL